MSGIAGSDPARATDAPAARLPGRFLLVAFRRVADGTSVHLALGRGHSVADAFHSARDRVHGLVGEVRDFVEEVLGPLGIVAVHDFALPGGATIAETGAVAAEV